VGNVQEGGQGTAERRRILPAIRRSAERGQPMGKAGAADAVGYGGGHLRRKVQERHGGRERADPCAGGVRSAEDQGGGGVHGRTHAAVRHGKPLRAVLSWLPRIPDQAAVRPVDDGAFPQKVHGGGHRENQ